MSPEPAALDHLGLLARLQGEFLASIAQVDPATPVPWCGAWQVRDLVEHLTQVHRWAAAQAARAPETWPTGAGDVDAAAHPAELPDPAESLGLVPSYERAADELREALAAPAPGALCALLDDEPGPVSFWHRRQLHETLVHLWDLRTAGELALTVEPRVWADTVDEVVTVMQPRQVRLGRMAALPGRIRLVAADAARDWDLHAHEDAPADPAVVVTGPAEQLALALWRRPTNEDRLTTTGDGELLRAALAQSLAP